jgi:hypothetical protein
MALVASGAGAAAKSGCLILQHFANMLLLMFAERLFGVISGGENSGSAVA